MNLLNKFWFITSLALLTGCSHHMVITPDIDPNNSKATKIDTKVAYYIPKNIVDELVTTPGGGGDKVDYYPYKDMDLPIYNLLSKKFSDVKKLKTMDERFQIKSDGYSYLIIPTIITSSMSSSAFTWPPTRFQLTLTFEVQDLLGNQVKTLTAIGNGTAEYYEFEKDFALSGKRAANEALNKMMIELNKAEL